MTSRKARLELLALDVYREKNRASFEEMYLTCAPQVAGYIRRRGASNEEAEDVIDETFARGWRIMCQRFIDKPLPFLYRIARNIALNSERKRIREARKVDKYHAGPGELPISALDTAEASENAINVRLALADLNPLHHEVISLRYFEHLQSPEIAKFLQIPENTVSSRLRLGLEALRTALAARYGSE